MQCKKKHIGIQAALLNLEISQPHSSPQIARSRGRLESCRDISHDEACDDDDDDGESRESRSRNLRHARLRHLASARRSLAQVGGVEDRVVTVKRLSSVHPMAWQLCTRLHWMHRRETPLPSLPPPSRISVHLAGTGLSKRNGAKLRERLCPAAASHSRPRQAGAQHNSPFFLHKPVQLEGKLFYWP